MKKVTRLGILFSHPTQHHSVLFNALAADPDLDVDIYYFDPGLVGQMHDPGYGNSRAWDVPLLSPKARILWNPGRGKKIVHWRQICPGSCYYPLLRKYDWVFCGSYSSPAAVASVLSAKLAGSRVIFQADTNIVNEIMKKRGQLFISYTNAILRQVDLFLAIGDKNYEYYKSRGINEEKIKFAPYPVDVKRIKKRINTVEAEAERKIARVQLDVPAGAVIFMFCGKIIERKRPADFIRALQELRREGHNVFGILVGSGELEDALNKNFGPEGGFTITGFINQTDIPLYLSLGDIGVVCSDYDPHPLVCTEMAACALPLVVSDRCGVWGPNDILRPGENGYIYPVGDVTGLKNALCSLVQSEALRLDLGRRSAELAMTQSVEVAHVQWRRALGLANVAD